MFTARTLFYAILVLALLGAAFYAWYGIWWVAVVNTAIVAVVLWTEAHEEHWILRWRLWRRERTLRDLDWAIDDADDDMLTERWAHGAGTDRLHDLAAQLRALHVERDRLCTEILGLRLALDVPALADLEHVSAWADSRPVDMTAREADAEVRRVRSL